MPDETQPAEQLTSPSEGWENEGGHMSSRFGHIVRDPAGQKPYKVILSHDQGADSQRAFATMRDAEALFAGTHRGQRLEARFGIETRRKANHFLRRLVREHRLTNVTLQH